MTCDPQTMTGTTKGILIAYDATDTGDRPLAAGIAFYVTPNIRLAVQADLQNLTDPAKWDQPPYAGWNGQVDEGSVYYLLARIRNTDSQQRADVNLQGWVSNYTAGGVGPGSMIGQDPNQPVSPTNPGVEFTGFNLGPLPVANSTNPNDPSSMLVLVSNETWQPNPAQVAFNGGHVCVAVNVFAEATSGEGGSTPADGGSLSNGFLDPNCSRMWGQRNIQLVTLSPHKQIQLPIMLAVPITDRCPLNADVGIHPVQLKVDQNGVVQDVPELAQAASTNGIETVRLAQGNPLAHVNIGNGSSGGGDDGHNSDNGDNGDNGHNGHNGDNGGRRHLKVSLQPGQSKNLKLTVDANNQQPGDAYALDLITTDTATNRLYGAARVYVLVT